MKNQNFKWQTVLFWAIVTSSLSLSPAVFGVTDPASPTTQWSPVFYGNSVASDPAHDQQTGHAELDIIGNASEPALYTQYADGYLGFRLRLGADAKPLGFNGCALVGLDMNLDGALNLFVGVNNQDNRDQIGIWYPGSGANTSPKNTRVGAPYQTYTETFPIYNFSPVSAVSDPAAVNDDLNADYRADEFLTFFVPLSDITSALTAGGIVCNTAGLMNLVAGTSTQLNEFNADICGVNGGINSCQSWTQLGATSAPVHLVPVPEPSPNWLFSLAAGVALLRLIVSKRRH